MFLNILGTCVYHLDPAKLLSVPRLVWKADLKNDEVKLELLTDIDMLIMAEKVLEEEYVTQFIDMQKLKINI